MDNSMRNILFFRIPVCMKSAWQRGVCGSIFCLMIVAGMPERGHSEEKTVSTDIMAASPEHRENVCKETGAASPTWHLGPDYGLQMFPKGDFYRPYVADVHRTGFGIERMHVTKGKIPGAGSSRYVLKAGGYFGVVRIQPADNQDAGVQLDIGGGLDGQFDIDFFRDNIGWNGHYGMILTAAPDRDLAFKLGMQHISAHLGDESPEKLGRGRIDYSRMELASGISWNFARQWRT
jgi:hypothetical protein